MTYQKQTQTQIRTQSSFIDIVFILVFAVAFGISLYDSLNTRDRLRKLEIKTTAIEKGQVECSN